MNRSTCNPIINRNHIQAADAHFSDVSGTFNPGVVKVGGVYHMILRVQARSRETYLFAGTSADGVHFDFKKEPIFFEGIEKISAKIYHIYDARITPIDKQYWIVFAMDMQDGCYLGLGSTTDFVSFRFEGIISEDDNRNGVLFPEKIKGLYHRLDRPNRAFHESGPKSGSYIQHSVSADMLHWQAQNIVMEGRFHYWDEFIGAGPPPIKTRQGWLLVYHGVATHFSSANIYQAGVALLDLNEPEILIGRCRNNILEPRETWELNGQVPNVVFPSGLIVESYDPDGFAENESEVKIYYGAADTVVGLATTTVSALLAATAENPLI